MTLNGIPLNGQAFEKHAAAADDGADADMVEDGGEPTNERYLRYLNSSQDEVSEPAEWANFHYAHMDQFSYERMIAYSRANRIRLTRAPRTLRDRHDAAASHSNWEEVANYL